MGLVDGLMWGGFVDKWFAIGGVEIAISDTNGLEEVLRIGGETHLLIQWETDKNELWYHQLKNSSDHW